MSTWHQAKNQGVIMDLWRPHPTKWKCVHDRYNQPASCMTFDTEEDAQAYAAATDATIIRPKQTNGEG